MTSKSIDQLQDELERLRRAVAQQENEIQQVLGKALGFPYYADDQKTFPGSTRQDGVFTGIHVAATLADLAAQRLNELQQKMREPPVLTEAEARRQETGAYLLSDYANALSGEGPLAVTWVEQPRRFVHSLIEFAEERQRKNEP